MMEKEVTARTVPFPPESVRALKGRMATFPVSRDCTGFWLDSFNAWVELWNKHESCRDLPCNPEWPEAHIFDCALFQESDRAFSIKKQKHLVHQIQEVTDLYGLARRRQKA